MIKANEKNNIKPTKSVQYTSSTVVTHKTVTHACRGDEPSSPCISLWWWICEYSKIYTVARASILGYSKFTVHYEGQVMHNIHQVIAIDSVQWIVKNPTFWQSAPGICEGEQLPQRSIPAGPVFRSVQMGQLHRLWPILLWAGLLLQCEKGAGRTYSDPYQWGPAWLCSLCKWAGCMSNDLYSNMYGQCHIEYFFKSQAQIYKTFNQL